MHVLTKIFVVLVSLLSILLVPLVVVYAHNEDSFKARYEAASARAAAADNNLQQQQIAHGAEISRLELELRDRAATNQQLARDLAAAQADLQSAKSDLIASTAEQTKFRSDLATIASAVSAGQDVMESLLGEVRTIRGEALAAERRAVELDEALRDVSGQLESAVAARRAMEEELQQLKEEHAHSMEQLGAFVQKFGKLELDARPPAPMIDLDATVTRVRRGNDQTLAEINAGSRDGVKEGWIMTIGRAGSYLGNLRIIAVDINRATGVVELEDPSGRGKVEAGDRVYARRDAG